MTNTARDVGRLVSPPLGSPPPIFAPTGEEVRFRYAFRSLGITSSVSESHLLPPARERPLRSPAPESRVDEALLARALAHIEAVDPADSYNTTLQLAAMASCVMEMWESASASSQHHQDILAILDNAVRQAKASDTVTRQHLDSFREALVYLGLPQLVRDNVDVVRSRFIRENFGPLDFIGEAEE